MSIFKIFKSREVVGGDIAYYNLTEWWLGEFNKQERDYIVKNFQPLGGSGEELVKGDVQCCSGSAISLLSNLASWFKNEKDRKIGYRLLEKGERLIDSNSRILDIHFFYQNKLEFYYRFRDIDQGALDVAIEACKSQIDISNKASLAFKKEYKDESLPTHIGYKQLVIILEKQKKYNEVINFCKQAKEQGWSGEWDKIVIRCNKKKLKEKNDN